MGRGGLLYPHLPHVRPSFQRHQPLPHEVPASPESVLLRILQTLWVPRSCIPAEFILPISPGGGGCRGSHRLRGLMTGPCACQSGWTPSPEVAGPARFLGPRTSKDRLQAPLDPGPQRSPPSALLLLLTSLRGHRFPRGRWSQNYSLRRVPVTARPLPPGLPWKLNPFPAVLGGWAAWVPLQDWPDVHPPVSMATVTLACLLPLTDALGTGVAHPSSWYLKEEAI